MCYKYETEDNYHLTMDLADLMERLAHTLKQNKHTLYLNLYEWFQKHGDS